MKVIRRIRDRGLVAGAGLAVLLVIVVVAAVAVLGGLVLNAQLSPTPTRSYASTLSHTPVLTPTPTPTPVPSPTPTLTPSPTPTYSPPPSFARPTETYLTPGPSPTPISTRGPVPTPTFGPDARGRAIVVDQDAQTLTVYEGENVLRVIPCSTGKPDTPTPPWTGVVGRYRPWFESFDTRVNDAWWLFREWDGNYYIHGLSFTVENGVKVYQDREFLGQRPVSHGCIRISPEDAEWLTWWNPLGVPCTITLMTRTNWK